MNRPVLMTNVYAFDDDEVANVSVSPAPDDVVRNPLVAANVTDVEFAPLQYPISVPETVIGKLLVKV